MSDTIDGAVTNVTDADATAELTPVVIEGAPDEADTAGTELELFQKMLVAGFDEDAAEEIKRTIEADQSGTAEAIKVEAVPSTPRVAPFALMVDNTMSMQHGNMIDKARAAHDQVLDYVQAKTAGEPNVTVLATTVLMNSVFGRDTVLFPYTPIADAPRFGNQPIELDPEGLTAWFDRFAELLAAIATECERLEGHNKSVTGLAGLLADGIDNDSRLHNITTFAKVVRGFNRTKTIFPFIVYVGEMPEPGTFGYAEERDRALRIATRLGVDLDDELMFAGTLEAIIRSIFTTAGFKSDLVFTPGQDMQKLVDVIIAISKMMVTASKGQLMLHDDI